MVRKRKTHANANMMTINDKTWKSVEKQLKWHYSGKLLNVHEFIMHGAIQRLRKVLGWYGHAKFREHMLFTHHPHLD